MSEKTSRFVYLNIKTMDGDSNHNVMFKVAEILNKEYSDYHIVEGTITTKTLGISQTPIEFSCLLELDKDCVTVEIPDFNHLDVRVIE